MIQTNGTVKTALLDVPEALTQVLNVKTFKHDRLTVSFSVASQALDQFEIRGKNHKDAPEVTLFSTAQQYGTPAGLLLACNDDLTTVSAAADGFFILDCGGLHEVTLYAASGNVAGSDVTLFASLR
jgi:hypothetical protein